MQGRPVPVFLRKAIGAGLFAGLFVLSPASAQDSAPAPTGRPAQDQQSRQYEALVEAHGQPYLEQNPLTATVEGGTNGRDEAPPETAPPRRQDEDPFAAPGIRVHGWTFRPSLETGVGYTDNANSAGPKAARRGSALWRLRPQIDFESGWSRHGLAGSLSLTHEQYRLPGIEDRNDIDAALRGHLDITRDLVLEGGLSYGRTRQSLADPDVPAAALKEPVIDHLAGEASLTQRLGRYFVALFGSIERAVHESVPASGGGVIDNSDRDYTRYLGGLRLGYDLSDRTSLFAELSADSTVHDRAVDDNGTLRGSKGYTASVGYRLEGDTLKSEGRIGFRIAEPDDPAFADIRGFVADGSLTWQATPLTSFTLRSSADYEETVLAGTSTIRRHEVALDIEHALRRNLILSGTVGWRRSDYVGSARVIDELNASAGIEYRLNRRLALRGTYEFLSSQSTIAGESYEAGTVMMGVIMRR